MIKNKNQVVGITLIVGLIIITYFAFFCKSQFLEDPKQGRYAILIMVSKDAPKKESKDFAEKIRDFPGNSYDVPSLVKSENSNYVLFRINRSCNKEPNINSAISLIEQLAKDFNIKEHVDFAVITDEGTLKTSNSFNIRVFP